MISTDPRERCTVLITRKAGGYDFSTLEGARCENMAGQRAVLYGTLAFPAKCRVGKADAEFSKPNDIGNLNCDQPRRRR
jgi:hypothetical protein